MLAPQRHQEIVNRIGSRGSVRTSELAEDFGVTHETIRKDLEILESEQKLIRTHGGAVKVSGERVELPLVQRQVLNHFEKEQIGKKAADLISPGDVILLDASSTALELARALPDVRVTVLTNAHNIVSLLGARPNVNLICTGGNFDPQSRSYIGPLADEAVRRYNINTMFFSGTGIDLERGVSEANEGQANFKERMMEHAEKVVLLADHTKFDTRAAFFFAELEKVDVIVTDPEVDADLSGVLEKFGCELVK